MSRNNTSVNAASRSDIQDDAAFVLRFRRMDDAFHLELGVPDHPTALGVSQSDANRELGGPALATGSKPRSAVSALMSGSAMSKMAFLFVAPALPITGAVGSPTNPLAI
jgi:hypothetical protein